LKKKEVIKVIPTDEALADSEADGCWAAFVFKDPSGLNAFCDFLSGFEELMKK
jgi:hypothetical protein